jgi:alkanesulfonate monooxygenase SsuD/methylene tetrahydromethanopterin reductase-like flavin-dependent oxidoreductase (luciferase family)
VQKPHPPVLVAGNFPGGLRRALRYGDGWVPLGGDPEMMTEVRKRAVEAGRAEDFPVSIYFCPTDVDPVARYRDAGVARVIFMLPADGRDAALSALDEAAAVCKQVGN